MTLYIQPIATEDRCISMKHGRENRTNGNEKGCEENGKKGRQEKVTAVQPFTNGGRGNRVPQSFLAA
jgi:hypothetical protein